MCALAVALTTALLAVGVFGGTLADRAAAQDPAAPGVGPGPLGQAAKAYAREHGVGTREAARRLRLQDPAGKLSAALVEVERGTFAGLFIQHEPTFRVVARFTEGGEEQVRSSVRGGPLAGVVETRPARRTLAELEAAQARATLILEEYAKVPAESWVNVQGNSVELRVVDRARLADALRSAGVGLPGGVEVEETPALLGPQRDIFAGLGMSSGCTTGYTVRHSGGGTGVTTAAHCANSASAAGAALGTMMDERFRDSWDVQWFATPNHVDRPWVNTPNAPVPYFTVTGTEPRSTQVQGDTVCKRGITTGTTCGTINSNSYRPDEAPPNATATYFLVR